MFHIFSSGVGGARSVMNLFSVFRATRPAAKRAELRVLPKRPESHSPEHRHASRTRPVAARGRGRALAPAASGNGARRARGARPRARRQQICRYPLRGGAALPQPQRRALRIIASIRELKHLCLTYKYINTKGKPQKLILWSRWGSGRTKKNSSFSYFHINHRIED